MNAIKDLLQRIRTDREKKQGTWIGIDESHIILNALEKSERIEAENAELRARLEKAGELPCEVGDTLYEPFINRIREWIVDSIYVFSLGTNVNCERKDDCRWHDHFAIRENSNDFESRVYLTREAAEARLKELQGGER